MQVSGIVKVDGIIELPDTWQGKIEPESIVVQLTPIGVSQELFVYGVQYGAKVVIRNGAGGPINAYYTVTANVKELPVVEDHEDDHLITCDY
tara:strand:+ start:992 stop:1267 length:276 start_codon:yes stop_codon:yes gene_type:complete